MQRVQLEAIDHNISNQKIAELMSGLEQRPIHLMGKTQNKQSFKKGILNGAQAKSSLAWPSNALKNNQF